MKSIVKYIKDPRKIKLWLQSRYYRSRYARHLPDEIFLKQMFRMRLGRELNLTEPQSFSEKLQWLKLHDRRREYTTMVDKDAAKTYAAGKIGWESIIPTLGVWDRFEDIDFDTLPRQFVLKCTHDSGGLVIVRDRDSFDRAAAQKRINRSLARNYYWQGREWPYKNVKPRVLAEAFMADARQERSLTDFKFYCFNGNPRFLYVSEGLENHETARISFLTMDWQFAPYQRSDFKPYDHLPPKPETFDRMCEICRKLSEGIPFLRVDLYEINGQVYFSELTFFPCSGFMPLRNPEHDLEIGAMLTLPEPLV